jgi:hypothetical protein
MTNRCSLAAPLLGIALILSACQDPGTPTQLTAPSSVATFTIASDAGDDQVPEPGSAAQTVNMPSGSDFICVGIFTGVFDDVLVPAGTFCWLMNAVVNGNIKALENSALVVQRSQVHGNIHGDKADAVQLTNNRVGGSIHITQGGVGAFLLFEVLICDTHLPAGNIQVEKMRGSFGIGLVPTRPDVIAFCGGGPQGNRLDKGNVKVEDNFVLARVQGMDIRQNIIRQNLQVFKNVGPGPKFVQGNTAGESVQCKENAPLFVGGPNAAQTREGQCF